VSPRPGVRRRPLSKAAGDVVLGSRASRSGRAPSRARPRELRHKARLGEHVEGGADEAVAFSEVVGDAAEAPARSRSPPRARAAARRCRSARSRRRRRGRRPREGAARASRARDPEDRRRWRAALLHLGPQETTQARRGERRIAWRPPWSRRPEQEVLEEGGQAVVAARKAGAGRLNVADEAHPVANQLAAAVAAQELPPLQKTDRQGGEALPLAAVVAAAVATGHSATSVAARPGARGATTRARPRPFRRRAARAIRSSARRPSSPRDRLVEPLRVNARGRGRAGRRQTS
jgi:hypothetical protein